MPAARDPVKKKAKTPKSSIFGAGLPATPQFNPIPVPKPKPRAKVKPVIASNDQPRAAGQMNRGKPAIPEGIRALQNIRWQLKNRKAPMRDAADSLPISKNVRVPARRNLFFDPIFRPSRKGDRKGRLYVDQSRSRGRLGLPGVRDADPVDWALEDLMNAKLPQEQRDKAAQRLVKLGAVPPRFKPLGFTETKRGQSIYLGRKDGKPTYGNFVTRKYGDREVKGFIDGDGNFKPSKGPLINVLEGIARPVGLTAKTIGAAAKMLQGDLRPVGGKPLGNVDKIQTSGVSGKDIGINNIAQRTLTRGAAATGGLVLEAFDRPAAAAESGLGKGLVELGAIKGDTAEKIRKAKDPFEVFTTGRDWSKDVTGGDITKGLGGPRELGLAVDLVWDPLMWAGVALAPETGGASLAVGLRRLEKIAPDLIHSDEVQALARQGMKGEKEAKEASRQLQAIVKAQRGSLLQRARQRNIHQTVKTAKETSAKPAEITYLSKWRNREKTYPNRQRPSNATPVVEQIMRNAEHRKVKPEFAIRLMYPTGRTIKAFNTHIKLDKVPDIFQSRAAIKEQKRYAAQSVTSRSAEERRRLMEEFDDSIRRAQAAGDTVLARDLRIERGELDDRLRGIQSKSEKEAADAVGRRTIGDIADARNAKAQLHSARLWGDEFGRMTEGHYARNIDKAVQPLMKTLRGEERHQSMQRAVLYAEAETHNPVAYREFVEQMGPLTREEELVKKNLLEVYREMRDQGKASGTLARSLEDYLPRMWERGEDPSSVARTQIRMRGERRSADALKQRSIRAFTDWADKEEVADALAKLSHRRLGAEEARKLADTLHEGGTDRFIADLMLREMRIKGTRGLPVNDLTPTELETAARLARSPLERRSKHNPGETPLFKFPGVDDFREAMVAVRGARQHGIDDFMDDIARLTDPEQGRAARVLAALHVEYKIDNALASVKPGTDLHRDLLAMRERNLTTMREADGLSAEWHAGTEGRRADETPVDGQVMPDATPAAAAGAREGDAVPPDFDGDLASRQLDPEMQRDLPDVPGVREAEDVPGGPRSAAEWRQEMRERAFRQTQKELEPGDGKNYIRPDRTSKDIEEELKGELKAKLARLGEMKTKHKLSADDVKELRATLNAQYKEMIAAARIDPSGFIARQGQKKLDAVPPKRYGTDIVRVGEEIVEGTEVPRSVGQAVQKGDGYIEGSAADSFKELPPGAKHEGELEAQAEQQLGTALRAYPGHWETFFRDNVEFIKGPLSKDEYAQHWNLRMLYPRGAEAPRDQNVMDWWGTTQDLALEGVLKDYRSKAKDMLQLDPRVSGHYRAKLQGAITAISGRLGGIDKVVGRSTDEYGSRMATLPDGRRVNAAEMKPVYDDNARIIGWWVEAENAGLARHEPNFFAGDELVPPAGTVGNPAPPPVWHKREDVKFDEDTLIPSEGTGRHDVGIVPKGGIWLDPQTDTEYMMAREWLNANEMGFMAEQVAHDRVWPSQTLSQLKKELGGAGVFDQVYWDTLQQMGVERFMGLIRFGVTTPFPAYHVRNLISDLIKSVQADSGVLFHPIVNFKLAATAMSDGRWGRGMTFRVPGFGRMKMEDFLFMADMFGAKSGHHISDIAKMMRTNWDELDGPAAAERMKGIFSWVVPGGASTRFGDDRENIVRYMTFFQALRANGGDVADASMYMIRHHFNYNDLKQGERLYIRNLFLFYTWYRRNIPLQLVELARRPGFFAGISHTYNALAQGETPLNAIGPFQGPAPAQPGTPEYVKDSLISATTAWKGHAMNVGFGAPWADLNWLSADHFMEFFAVNANPLIMTPLQTGISVKGEQSAFPLRRDPLTGREFREYESSGQVEILGQIWEAISGDELPRDDQGKRILPWRAMYILRQFPLVGRSTYGFGRDTGLRDPGRLQSLAISPLATNLTGLNVYIAPLPGSKREKQAIMNKLKGRVAERVVYNSRLSNLPQAERDRLLKKFDEETLKKYSDIGLTPKQLKSYLRKTKGSGSYVRKPRVNKGGSLF